MAGIVVIGAGQAGAVVVEKLRAGGFDGPHTLIGDEPDLPYQRPPLSKKYLLGEMERERLFLRPQSFYDEADVRLHLGTRAEEIDRDGKAVRLSTGERVAYDRLVLATGAPPRRLPASIGGALEGVFTIRTLADIDALQPKVQEGRHVLVVGGGYIGLEAAAVSAGLGLKVTLVEQAPRLLQRVAASQTADYFRALHTAHGVDIREGTGLARLTGDGHVTGAELEDGSKLDVDFVIVGVGVTPATALAEAAGLECDNGIVVNGLGQCSDPDIFAAGDCASFPYQGGRIRLESVPHAIDHAGAVAASILGGAENYSAKPWFWSDQYDVKLQIAGLNTGFDQVVVREGGKPGSVSHWYYAGPRLLAVDAMNDPRAYMTAKRWIEAGVSPAPQDVPEGNLKTMATA
ncbi:MAG: FAD-dependent oxidoreductase [Pseudomonadota bacterium]